MPVDVTHRRRVRSHGDDVHDQTGVLVADRAADTTEAPYNGGRQSQLPQLGSRSRRRGTRSCHRVPPERRWCPSRRQRTETRPGRSSDALGATSFAVRPRFRPVVAVDSPKVRGRRRLVSLGRQGARKPGTLRTRTSRRSVQVFPKLTPRYRRPSATADTPRGASPPRPLALLRLPRSPRVGGRVRRASPCSWGASPRIDR